MTTAERTYRIEERLTAAGVAAPINVIAGLSKESADLVAEALRSGSAYQSLERELTIVVEKTAAEIQAEAVEAWRTTGKALNRTTHLRAALQSMLDDLDGLGDQELPDTYLTVSMSVDAPAAAAAAKTRAVEVVAAVLELGTARTDGGHLSTPAGRPIRVMTATADVEPVLLQMPDRAPKRAGAGGAGGGRSVRPRRATRAVLDTHTVRGDR